MSIEALDMLGHVHGFEDDLESFIYVVLYAALRWLPVESPHLLHWRFTTFFGAPDPEGCGGGADAKQNNVISHKYTRSLKTTRSAQVLQWVNDAVDLHYKGWRLNPDWVGGKALKRMWEERLKGELPIDDRCVNLAPGMEVDESRSLYMTYIAGAPPMALSGHDDEFQLTGTTSSKRSQEASGDELAATSRNPKRLRLGMLF